MSRPPLPVGTWGRITRTRLGADRWRARAKFRDHDGVTRTVERIGPTGAAAERALVTHLRDRSRPPGGAELTAATTVGDLAAVWLGTLDDGRRAPQTVEKYTSAVHRFVVPALGGIRIGEVSVGRIERFLGVVESDAAARWCRVALTGMFSLAARHDAVAHNPVRDTSTRQRPASEVRALTLEEVAALRANITGWAGGNTMGPPRGDDLPELVDFILGTGLRIGEALAVRWADVALGADVPTATVSGTVAYVGGRFIRQPTTKTSAGHRTVVLPGFVVAALRRQRERELPAEDGLVFPSARGGVRSPHNVRRQFRAARGVGFEWVTPHVLRKTTATVVERSVGIDAAAAQLGHTGSRVTAAHYVQRAATAPDVRTALDALGPVSGG